jgi:hypothetical protein
MQQAPSPLASRLISSTCHCCCALQADLKASIKLPIVDGGPVDAFCGYFDVTFGGSEQNPAGEASAAADSSSSKQQQWQTAATAVAAAAAATATGTHGSRGRV